MYADVHATFLGTRCSILVTGRYVFPCYSLDQGRWFVTQRAATHPCRHTGLGATLPPLRSVKVSCRGRRRSAMVRSVDKQVRRESLECELRTVRSAIRTFREAAETAQDQSVMFQLERAEEKEVQLGPWRRSAPKPHTGTADGVFV